MLAPARRRRPPDQPAPVVVDVRREGEAERVARAARVPIAVLAALALAIERAPVGRVAREVGGAGVGGAEERDARERLPRRAARRRRRWPGSTSSSSGAGDGDDMLMLCFELMQTHVDEDAAPDSSTVVEHALDCSADDSVKEGPGQKSFEFSS